MSLETTSWEGCRRGACMYWKDSGDACLFGDGDFVIGGRSECPVDQCLCFPNTSHVCYTDWDNTWIWLKPQHQHWTNSLGSDSSPLPAPKAPALWDGKAEKHVSSSILFGLLERSPVRSSKQLYTFYFFIVSISLSKVLSAAF